jgi:RimJ/RimL family protein N-acetyltransferase
MRAPQGYCRLNVVADRFTSRGMNVPVSDSTVFVPDYPIQTDRLRLRPFNRGDVDAVFAYRSLPAVAKYLFDEPLTHDECAEAVRARVGQVAFAQEGDKILLAMERREDGRVIGEVSLIWRSALSAQAEVGFILDPAMQGRGFATEAAAAVLDFGFGAAGLHRIYARCDARNEASAGVMKRLGMRLEAHFREHALFKGAWDEELVYAVLDREWAARNASAPQRVATQL